MFWNRRVAIGAGIVIVIGLLIYGFWPEPTLVTVQYAQKDSLRVTVEEEGRTELQDRYVVSAPGTGYLRRVPSEVGDAVLKGEVVARLAALPSKVLDASAYEATEGEVQAAQAALRKAEQEAKGARSARDHAEEELERVRRLHRQETASQQQLDDARVAFDQAEARYEAAQEAVEQARGQLRAARSPLQHVTVEQLPIRHVLEAPVDGQILQVHHKSSGVVQAGTPLLSIGQPDSLEVVVDVLSSDAVRIEPGMPVDLVRWGAEEAGRLSGRVKTVPQQARTSVSALGVEEQRVDVVVTVADPPSARPRLGVGYRIVARIVLWEGADVLQVPRSALFREDGGWAVFVLQDGRAEQRSVEVGHRSGLWAEIKDGVTAETPVVTHPGNELQDGMRVQPR